MRRRARLLFIGAFVLAGCTGSAGTPTWTFAPAEPAPASETARVVEVFKSPSCGCCHEWEAYMRRHGWTVKSMPTEDMTAVKARHGLPKATWSCHTAVIDGYVVEGHVPMAAIDRLLESRPAIDGIALPDMPAGSPGMPGAQDAPFMVLSITDGQIGEFGSF